MRSLLKCSGLSEEIAQAMKQCDQAELAGYVGEFLEGKKESFTRRASGNEYYISSFFPAFPSSAWNRLMNGLSEIVYHDNRVPLQADIVVTGKCHCSCWHCFRANYGEEELGLNQIKETLSALDQMGTATVGITGGEPMLRPDILEIIEAIPDGMQGMLYTTGHGIDDAFAAKLKATNLTRCIISLDHYDEEMSGKLRRYPEAFQDAIQAIQALTRHGMYTAVTVCITHDLLKEGALRQYFQFAGGLGVQEVRVVLPIPQGNLEGNEVGRFYGKAMGMVKQLKREHEGDEQFPVIVNFCEFESSDYFGCGGGSNYIAINNDGNVSPCVSVPASFGNILERPLADIYHDMGKIFKRSDCSCYGIASGTVVKREHIDTSVTPLPIETSYEVASKCRISSERAALFQYCAARRSAREANV